jgi:DNA-binding NarL/FixJ family response regulator
VSQFTTRFALRPHLVAIRDVTFKRDAEASPLTRRQGQLLSLVAAGLTNRLIARQLGVSEHTVCKHVENIFERLQVNSRTAARCSAGRLSSAITSPMSPGAFKRTDWEGSG